METVKFGNTGLEVSPISLGTWAFASAAYGDVDRRQAHETIRAAVDHGVTLFDTAPLYGTKEGGDGISEKILGEGLGADRDRVLISTKFGRNPSTDCVPTFTGEQARRSVEESLRRLGTDRIDVLFFHSPFGPEEIHDDVWAALADLREAGKVRVVGHSISMFENTQQMARDWAAERKIEAIQVVYSLMNREARELIEAVGAMGTGVIARETLANGFLTDAVTRETVFPPNNLNSRYTRGEIAERVDYVDRLRFLVRGEVKSMPQAALRWVLSHGAVSSVLTGAKSPAELLDCLEAAAAPPYSAEEMARAEALHLKDYPAA